MLNRTAIKAEAKDLLRTGKVSPILVSALLLLITFFTSCLTDLVSGGSLFYTLQLQLADLQGQLNGDYSGYDALLKPVSGTATFVSVLSMLISCVLHAGYSRYLMEIRSGRETSISTLFSGFSQAGKLIWLEILMGIKVALWSFLFVIPGIIALYRYRFAVYNLLKDDSLSAGEAIRLSCRQTNGIKGQLFMLDLSFFGWSLLSLMTLDVLQVWLMPYMGLCDLAYYDDARFRMNDSGEADNRSKDPWEL